MTVVIGLTGSIGMGKSTTSKMFAEEGIPVWDADACVHNLYAPGGLATKEIAKRFPAAIIDRAVSRSTLKTMIARDPEVLDQIQTIVHPLVAANRAQFIAKATQDIVLLDIPLLFETGADAMCDYTVVVTAPPNVQRARVMDRGAMTEKEFEMILSRQMPDSEKRARANYVIETLTLDQTSKDVRQVIADIRGKQANA